MKGCWEAGPWREVGIWPLRLKYLRPGLQEARAGALDSQPGVARGFQGAQGHVLVSEEGG